jgi:hypothetical protein
MGGKVNSFWFMGLLFVPYSWLNKEQNPEVSASWRKGDDGSN